MNIFKLLGIDPRKEGEVYEYLENEDGTHLYGGFYHIVGRIIDGLIYGYQLMKEKSFLLLVITILR
jgi:hypothetical protein